MKLSYNGMSCRISFVSWFYCHLFSHKRLNQEITVKVRYFFRFYSDPFSNIRRYKIKDKYHLGSFFLNEAQ